MKIQKIIIDNNETNLDVSNKGFVIAVNITNPKVIDENRISVEQD
ncbi:MULTISPECIES: hypothetical protein [Acinetobacter]|nr:MULTISPECIES: hypothetical protein [Acinetobacter]MEC6124960.1 hypothetical protein [Acinetobacter ursingii]